MSDKPDDRARLDKFKDLARELEAGEDQARFEEAVQKIAPAQSKPRAPDNGG